MKRMVSILCLSALVVALGGSVCLGAEGLASPVNLSWGTASLGGAAQVIGTAVGVVVGRHEPNLRISVQATGGSLENVRLLRSQQLDIAHTTEGYSAVNGVGPFTGEGPTEMWVLFNMYSNEYVLCVLENSPIQTVADLEGQSISAGPPGSGTNQMSRAVFDAYGILDRVRLSNLGYNDAIDALQDGTIAAFGNFTSASFPNPSMSQMEQAVNYRILPLDPDKVRTICENNPDLSPEYIFGGSLKPIPEDFPTFASFSIQYADSKMSDEIAYALVKTLYDNIEEVGTYHQIATKMSINNALSGISEGVAVHPGAARFYKERGVWRDYLIEGKR